MKIPFLPGVGIPELIIILVVVLLIFGPKQLPKLGGAIGRTIKGLREGLSSSKDDKTEETKPTVNAETAADATH